MYQNNFLRKPACHGHNLHLGTEPQVLQPENSRLDRMNTPNTRPITSSLALNRLGSLCMRELVGLCHDALIWKTSKKLLKFKTQDQGWRNSELNLFEFEHLKRWLCSIWWNGQNIDRRARILSFWWKELTVPCRLSSHIRFAIKTHSARSTPAAMCHTGSDTMVTELFQA